MKAYRLYECAVDGTVEMFPGQALVVIQHGARLGEVRWWLQFSCPGCGELTDLEPASRSASVMWRNAGAADVVLEWPAEAGEVIRRAWMPQITAEEITDMEIDLTDDVWLQLAMAKLVGRYGRKS